ncbi:MAG TPA: biotin--[acetyl-CoA-carboxylase] ligase [Vicinamibacteria bacterium]|nr:biotin--[acetyl-CoA-carboxylase] ligase [Vicinamibacteria bacterium]
MSADLTAALEARGLHWPAPVEHLAEVASTNDLLKEKARAGAPEWSAVLADRQTAGRGRAGHRWVSPEGNLFLSVLLRPVLPAAHVPVLPLAAGLAVAEAAAEHVPDVRLKWPNDVVVGGRKLAGILVEGMSGAGGMEAAIVGIGLNVGLDPRSLPGDLRDRVTSLAAQTGRSVRVADAAAAVLARLRVWYDRLAREGPPVVIAAWRERSVAWWGRPVEARSGGSVLRGVAHGLDERGALLLDLEDGSRVAVVSGDVSELRLAGGGPLP